MDICHYIDILEDFLLLPTFLYNKYDNEKYYQDESVNIYIY